jgi:hypothetical protein
MTTKTAYFLDFELENVQPRNFSAAENATSVEEFLKSAEVKYQPSKIRRIFSTIRKIFLLLIAPAEFCRSLTEAEREEIGIKL